MRMLAVIVGVFGFLVWDMTENSGLDRVPAAHSAVWAPVVVVAEAGATPSATPSSPTGFVPDTATSFPRFAPPNMPAPRVSKSATSSSTQPEQEVAATPNATPAPTKGEAAVVVRKKLKSARAKKAPKDFDPDWNTKIFSQ